MRTPNWATVTQVMVTVALGGIGAAAGFTHTHNWADAHGQHDWLAWADAVVIEGMAVVSGFEVRRDHMAGRKGVTLPWVVLVLAFLVQMTAQVSQAEKSPEGWLLAAMPALGFLTVVKLLMRRIPDEKAHPVQAQAEKATEPRAQPEVKREAVKPQLSTSTISRLPVAMRKSLTELAEQVHRQGREIVAKDIGQTIKLPDQMLADLVTELNFTVNNRSVVEVSE